MKLIVAVDSKWNIGNNGKLLFKIPDDMKKFKEVTTETGVVIMGRKTFESIGRLLPGRVNIILSKSGITYQPKEDEKDIEYYCLPSIESVLENLKLHKLESKACIIGGATLYEQFLPYCNCAYVTRVINKEYEADTNIVDFNTLINWKLIDKSENKKCCDLIYRFEEYINFAPKSITYDKTI